MIYDKSLYDILGFPYANNYGWLNFIGVRERAANLHTCRNTKVYTPADFFNMFPQFQIKDTSVDPPTLTPVIPIPIIETLIGVANQIVLECVWGDLWEFAMGLVVAHLITLYLRSYSDGSDNPLEIADGGSIVGFGRSATLGDASVSFDNDLSTGGIDDWGLWGTTVYGQQFITFARLMGLGGSYII